MTTSRQLILAGTILGALGAGANAAGQARIEPTSPAAIVNGEVITKGQVEAVVKHIGQSEGQTNPAALSQSQSLSRRQMAVAVLIDDALWRQAIARQVPAPAQIEITKKMVALEDDLKKQGKTMQQFCDETAQTLAQVQTAMSFVLQWTNLVEAKSSDEALTAHYQQYKDYYDGTQVDVSHIAIHVAAAATEAERRAAQVKIMKIQEQIQNRQVTFEQAAETNSQCETKTKGGKVGLIPRKWGWFDEAFTRAAFDPSLKPGDIAGPVLTEYGYELIRVNARKAGVATTFAMVKEQVKNDFREDLRQRIIADQRKQSKVEIYSNVVEALP